MTSFFTSPYWLDVRRMLERAPQLLRGGGAQWTVEVNVARRLLEDRLRCVRKACDDADRLASYRLRMMLAGLEIETVVHGLLDALKEAVLIVGASVGVSAAVGAGVGALLGGVGAVPGAAIGATLGTQVGLWILGALGLASLAEFFLEGLPEILQHYHRGFSTAWRAVRDEVTEGGWQFEGEQSFQLRLASGSIAEGHVAMVMLLLSAIVAYLTRGRGDMRALAGEARTGRLGPSFAQWMVQHEEALRKHPALQPRQRRPTAAAGDGGSGPPAPPPPNSPRRDEREPGGPSRMPRKDVRCFKAEGLPESKVPEFDRQLEGQEVGLNQMTVEEYLAGREAFQNKTLKRSSKIAKDARELHHARLTRDFTEALRQEGLSAREAEVRAVELATEQMRTLAALHNPDLVTAGRDVIADFGDRNVNSSIGAQWNGGAKSRLDDLDAVAKAIPVSARVSTKMNAKLSRYM